MTWREAIDWSMAGCAVRRDKWRRLIIVNSDGKFGLKIGDWPKAEWRDCFPDEWQQWDALDDWEPLVLSDRRRSTLPKPPALEDAPRWKEYRWSQQSLECERKFGIAGRMLPYIDRQVRAADGRGGTLVQFYRHMNHGYYVGLVALNRGYVQMIPLGELLSDSVQ